MGRDYRVITFSFDPSEDLDLARDKASAYYSQLAPKPEKPWESWIFGISNSAEVSEILKDIGYKIRPDGQDFAHAAAIVVLSPTGVISRYFLGVDFSS